MQKVLVGQVAITAILVCAITLILLSIETNALANSNDHIHQPKNINYLDDFTAVSAGQTHTCGLTNAGTVYCWGQNDSGQLGNGTFNDSSTPVAVTQPAGVIFSSIDVGYIHSCALSTQGVAYCWGNNTALTIGDGTQTNRNIPKVVTMPADTTFSTIRAGAMSTCALSTTNTAYCWGVFKIPSSGDPGGYSSTPMALTLPAGSNSISQIDVGGQHICFITDVGTLYCFGYNTYGQLGKPTSINWSNYVAVEFPNGLSATHISAGGYHTCAVMSNSKLFCWGNNEYGQLGDGTGIISRTPKAIYLETEVSFTSVNAGNVHTCAEDSSANRYCWGNNDSGQLGTRDTFNHIVATPALQLADESINQISVNELHTCATTVSGRIYCWGANQKGQLGDGTMTANMFGARVGASLIPPSTASQTPTFSPTQAPSVDHLNAFVRMSIDATHSCALTTSGDAYCWGSNTYGQLGNTTTLRSTVPIAVKMPSGVSFTDINTHGAQNCAIADTGNAYCWGTEHPYPVLISIPDASSLTNISVGASHICVLTTTGTAICWGSNVYGELGNGDSDEINGNTNSYSNPVAVNMPPGEIFTQIQASLSHTCALTATGRVYCWGYNAFGQIGNGTMDNVVSPTEISTPSGITFTKIDTGNHFSCAQSNTMQLYCWGMNSSNQLGTNTYVESLVPTQVTALTGTTISDFQVGREHVCVITTNDDVFCWGASADGQLGAETDANTAVQVPLPIGTIAQSLALGSSHSCALTSTNQAYCWGSNTDGQLGDGTRVQSHIPQLVGGSNAIPATPTSTHTATLTSTPTATRTATKTPTRTATKTHTRTATKSHTRTVTKTATKTATRSRTRIPTSSPTRITNATRTKSPTRPRVPSLTKSPTRSR